MIKALALNSSFNDSGKSGEKGDMNVNKAEILTRIKNDIVKTLMASKAKQEILYKYLEETPSSEFYKYGPGYLFNKKKNFKYRKEKNKNRYLGESSSSESNERGKMSPKFDKYGPGYLIDLERFSNNVVEIEKRMNENKNILEKLENYKLKHRFTDERGQVYNIYVKNEELNVRETGKINYEDKEAAKLSKP